MSSILEQQSMALSDRDISIKLPSRMILAAPSGSGKSFFILNAIRHYRRVLSQPLSAIFYCFSEHSMSQADDQFRADLQAAYPDIIFNVGIPRFDILYRRWYKRL